MLRVSGMNADDYFTRGEGEGEGEGEGMGIMYALYVTNLHSCI